jgi:phage terminase large subunit-like protein
MVFFARSGNGDHAGRGRPTRNRPPGQVTLPAAIAALRDPARSLAERLALLPADERAELLAALTEEEAELLDFDWAFWRRPSQELPADFSVLLWMTGRGYGKTRIGAEAVNAWAHDNDRICLIGRTAKDVRDTMVEGESGILARSPKWWRPEYEPSKTRLTWPNGAIATTFTGEEPEALRGPQFKKGWFDELASWKYAQETFDNAMLAMRLGENPQVIITTTPKNVPVIRKLVKDPEVTIKGGTTYENMQNLASTFKRRIIGRFEGTRRGEQELLGKLLGDVVGALWKREWIESTRVPVGQVPPLQRVVVAVDPMARKTADEIRRDQSTDEEGDSETGIVVAGLAECRCRSAPGTPSEIHAFLLEDATVSGTPDVWGKAAIDAYKRHKADRIVGEINNGGDMVGYVIGTIDSRVPFTEVWASRGKWTRAEPISALYERGLVHHVGTFPELEDQLCTWVPGEKSPDRLDADVWAMAELFYPQKHAPDEIVTEEEGAVHISDY